MKPRLNLQTPCWQDARRDAQRLAQERTRRQMVFAMWTCYTLAAVLWLIYLCL